MMGAEVAAAETHDAVHEETKMTKRQPFEKHKTLVECVCACACVPVCLCLCACVCVCVCVCLFQTV